jgi:hypothetical protein
MNKSYKMFRMWHSNHNSEYCKQLQLLLDTALKRRIESENNELKEIKNQIKLKSLKKWFRTLKRYSWFFFKAGYAIWLFFLP